MGPTGLRSRALVLGVAVVEVQERLPEAQGKAVVELLVEAEVLAAAGAKATSAREVRQECRKTQKAEGAGTRV